MLENIFYLILHFYLLLRNNQDLTLKSCMFSDFFNIVNQDYIKFPGALTLIHVCRRLCQETSVNLILV